MPLRIPSITLAHPDPLLGICTARSGLSAPGPGPAHSSAQQGLPWLKRNPRGATYSEWSSHPRARGHQQGRSKLRDIPSSAVPACELLTCSGWKGRLVFPMSSAAAAACRRHVHILSGSHGLGAAGQIFLAAEAKWKLDHIVYAVNDLHEGIEHFHQLTGVEPCIGGRHEGLGTHNAIFSLGNSQTYFELIAADPSQRKDCPVPKWMGMDGAPLPRLLTWAARMASSEQGIHFKDTVAEITSRYEPGPVCSFERKVEKSESGELLKWSLAYNHYTWPLPGDGLIPFLIDWKPESLLQVNEAAASAGVCNFVRFEAQHPKPEHVQKVLESLGGVREMSAIRQATESRLFCVLDTPNGIVTV